MQNQSNRVKMSSPNNNKNNSHRTLSRNQQQFTYNTLLLSIFALIWPVDGFNFANQPNIAIPAPQHLKFFKPQTRSSYFGYTLVMRPTSEYEYAQPTQGQLVHCESQVNKFLPEITT
ncbi:PREDICTED: integrin alpha-PS3-like, partial [Rhagoletis zephyria]|uniref:integrin alpha-PS3-like n=1 Tax=Rhagoletis zephyria TaxID=28612 RepID=UPI000811784C